MKNSIIKFRYSIIALMMIVVNGVGAFASTPWTVNPGDYRYDMSLYLDVTFADGKMDYSQYYVAAFSGDECRGMAEVLSLGEGKECLYMRVRSNQESEAGMTFRYYNKNTGEIQPIDDVTFDFESNSRIGYPSDSWKVVIVRHYDVTLSAGAGGTLDKESSRFVEGSELTVEAIPAEGHHFTKWSDGSTENPRTLTVESHITLAAEFAVNTYKLVYNVDGELYKEFEVDYGTEITPEASPEKEGYTFSGWDEVPATMAAKDVTVSGTFAINSYNAVFRIGEEEVATVAVVFGQPVESPEAPAKEGHTFAGWADVPETMPAHDIEILGSYTVNTYKLVYNVDGELYKEFEVDYGTEITPEASPEKEGYTFSGWDEVPATMPARDVVVSGSFAINSYTLTIYLNDEIYGSETLEFGAPIVIEEVPEVPEGMEFKGWKDEVPEFMPAHDLEIHGEYSASTSVSFIHMDGNTEVTVVDLNGHVLYENLRWNDVIDRLENGLYIINGEKYAIRR